MNSLTKDIYVKQNLGKVGLSLLLMSSISLLDASNFSYASKVNNKTPYVKEAIILTFNVKQTNPNIVLLFDFDVKKSKHYSSQRIDIKEIDAYHAAEIQYTYLLYPLTSGSLDIEFTLIQKVTTDESIAYSFSGDRDNVKTLETQNTIMNVSTLKLNVQPLPLGTEIVGDFNLDYKLDALLAKAYEPLGFQVILKGLGYPPLLSSLLPSDTNITTFSEDPLVTSTSTYNGTQSTVIYPMAFSHDKNFTLEPITINAFNPKTKKTYTLNIPKQHFNITTVNEDNLVDTLDFPKNAVIDWSWIQTFITYLIVFLAGYLSALFYTKKSPVLLYTKQPNPLAQKIKESATQKHLLQLLLSQDTKKFSHCIEKLESSLYKNEPINLKTLKKEALETLK